MSTSVHLFHLDFYRVTPEQHDALCRAAERELRDEGLFDQLDFEARREAVMKIVHQRLPWGAGRVGRLQTELRDGKFYADLHVGAPAAMKYRESLSLGSVEDDTAALRKAFSAAASWAGDRVPGAVYCEEEAYRMLVERFDFTRFCQDHRLTLPTGAAQRVSRWN